MHLNDEKAIACSWAASTWCRIGAAMRLKLQGPMQAGGEALDDPRPGVNHEQVEAHFARRRAAALLKVGKGGA
ncbi:hypothetical protein [Variovorax paradoxus]|jgi:hypothetical protein|uniref:hypothetical protein n=1 Tax=Variovorax paradoxus TaxID=34073 RepID=UPI00339B58DE